VAASDVIIEHPNREKASSKTTKAVVVLLMLASAVLVTVVTVGGWDALQGGQPVQIAYVLIYVALAYFIARWRSGMLPVAAALAIVLAIFAAVAGPEWFARDKEGFENPALDENLLGVLTFLIVPIQALLIAFAMQGFSQRWSVEVERHPDGTRRAAV
jgi:hypothetical protein